MSADEEATLEELEERIEACRTQLEYKVSEVKELYKRQIFFRVTYCTSPSVTT